MAALKLQAAGNPGGEGEDGGSGEKQPTIAEENDAAWEVKLADNTKASDEKLANLEARHKETLEVRCCDATLEENVSMLTGTTKHCSVHDTTHRRQPK